MRGGRRTRNNPIVAIFIAVVVEIQTSAACDVRGLSGQDGALSPPCAPAKREALALPFRDSFPPPPQKNFKFSGGGDVLTREIRIKQGRLRGVVREFKTEKLGNVETYLGIPYAAPPVKNLRFMPPGSPPTWKNVKIFEGYGPACPQTPPDLSHEPFKTMNAGYFNRLKGLLPFLANQSEDCLYLNIYAPVRDHKFQSKYPVIVYVHGESFEWNSGNPYDGSVLASYGSVVVVTINFRLGILGFLRPGLSEHTVSNFGLLDQIAALQWIKDNIEEFGGDPSSVTLMGHGTGAACINFLMVSPVSMASEGLFHKAILMSGTALSDWALTSNPLQFTIQVAEALNCPLVDKNDELSNCLRRKRLSEIMGVKITVPDFQTPFGPIVDGSVVPNTPHQVMGVYQNLFTRYELLYGITEWETYHALDPVSLTYGMLEGERNDLLRKFMYSRYEALPFFALATTLSEYLDWRKGIPPAKSAAEEHRDLVLDLLSDARYAAPVVQMALYHSRINPKSYLYVFKHKSKMGEFAGSERSVSGEEIPYVFGAPLVNEEGPLAHHKFSVSEQLLSESILTYFTNFVKTGNPNAPRRLEYLNQGPREWQQYDIYWPEYDSMNQSYLSIDIPPHVSHHYRTQMTQYWNEILPDLLKNPTKLKQHKPEFPSEGDARTYKKPSVPYPRKEEDDSGPWTYGTVRMSPKEYHRGKRPFPSEEESASSKQMDRPPEEAEGRQPGDGTTTVSAVPYFVGVTLCLLAINAVVLGFYFYKKRKSTSAVSPRDSSTVEGNQKTKDRESGYSVVECAEESKTEKPSRLKRCLGDSTTVKKWIQQEIFDKYSKSKKTPETSSNPSPKAPQKSDSLSVGSSRSAPMPKPILKNSRRICQSNEDLKSACRKSVQKVSVGVDATPSTRGESVLKQTPIEITKSLDRGLLKLQTPKLEESSRKSRTSVSLQLLPTNLTSAEPDWEFESSKNTLRSFSSKDPRDINVTSRDSEVVTEATYVDPLENMQKRNFPKVLPDFPEPRTGMRLSFPQPSESHRHKSHPPPPPPPRVSTLQRKNKHDAEGTSRSISEGGQKKDSAAKEDESESSEKSDSCKSVIVRPEPRKKREPSIVIQPKVGPRKASDKNGPPKKAHINLQSKEPEKSEKFRLDSKGPSDKIKGNEKSFKP